MLEKWFKELQVGQKCKVCPRVGTGGKATLLPKPKVDPLNGGGFGISQTQHLTQLYTRLFLNIEVPQVISHTPDSVCSTDRC